jgi:iron complex transport system permease protein
MRHNNILGMGGASPSPAPAAYGGKREGFRAGELVLFSLATLATMALCVCVGSVSLPLKETLSVIWNATFNLPMPQGVSVPIILSVRLPRVLCVALTGAALSICGAAMQGLLKNPLADGSTLGVSSGASLGAVIAIAFGITIPGIPFAGSMVLAIAFAFLSLLIILSLAQKIDYSMSTNTIILIGVIYSMFVSSILALIVTFASDHVKQITFWTMGSLLGASMQNALVLLGSLVVFGGVILRYARELNAFAISEDNARNVGVPVKRIKLVLLIAVSALVGVCVSVGGTIGFVGLVTPHMVRMIVGPNHRRLLPASLFGGAIFLMLADLVARILLNPIELPIGVVTSFVGAFLFIAIFYRSRRARV